MSNDPSMLRVALVALLGAIVSASWAGDRALAEPRTGQRFERPVPMGTSCGNWQSSPFLYTGTCGLRVRFLSAPQLTGILSNNHVLGAAGPSVCPGTAVPFQTLTLQPGTLDIGDIPADPSAFAVGVVAGFVPVRFSSDNVVDAAAALTTPAHAATTILGLGEPVPAIAAPAAGMEVHKTGRTTDTTIGTVISVATTVLVGYRTCGTARFVGQIVITPGAFSRGGDSGAVVLERSTNIPVGLLFAGSATQSVANDIRLVYLALGVYPDAGPGRTSEVFSSREALIAEIASTATEDLARAERVRARVEPEFFRNPGVVGLGVGLDDAGRAPALIVYTNESGPGPSVEQVLPKNVDGFPVRIVPSGAFDAYDW